MNVFPKNVTDKYFPSWILFGNFSLNKNIDKRVKDEMIKNKNREEKNWRNVEWFIYIFDHCLERILCVVQSWKHILQTDTFMGCDARSFQLSLKTNLVYQAWKVKLLLKFSETAVLMTEGQFRVEAEFQSSP